MAVTLLLVMAASGFAAALILSNIIIMSSMKRRQQGNKARKPPSPPKLPILGNLHQVGKYPHRIFPALAKRCGAPDLMLLHFGSRPVLVVSTSKAAREVMKTHDLISSDRPERKTAKKLLYGNKDIVNARYGEHWRLSRRLCVLHLLSNKKIRSCRPLREEEIGLLVNRIRTSAQAGQEVNLSALLPCFTNDVICRIALGRKYDGNTVFRDLLAEIMELFIAFSVGEFIPQLSWVSRLTGFDARVDRVARRFDEFLDGAVLESEARLEKRSNMIEREEEEEEGQAVPLIDVLLQLQRDSPEECHLDGDGIKAVIMDMFIGGTDTTSTLLEWTMSELMKHPRVMKKLQEEVRREAGVIICEENLHKLEYLKLVIKETTRLHPPVPLLPPRQLMQDATIMGYDVSAGTMILTNAWGIGRDPADWGESPEEFLPERFLQTKVDFIGQDFELIPFGAGRRRCPGISFGLAVVEVALANLVRDFDWRLPGGMRLEMTECVGLTARRDVPLLAIPTIVPAGPT
ncbi:unnamed protein product [Linum tenue]|uniref:Cytochrome P450 n=1 Tax=Linum tenue TaxID=586396 RepID=A0AAV0JKE2_9ROSI|nr:unnamed protein product [Linum tenue]